MAVAAGSETSAGALVAEIERLLAHAEAIEDPDTAAFVGALVQGLVDLYGAGLERIVDVLAAHDERGELAELLAEDELVAHLLLLHGLHPLGVWERVLEALGEVRPYLESHGGNVELLAIEGPVVRLRMAGSCHGCPSSAMTLKLAIEQAIHRHAPEIAEVVAEEAPAPLLQISLAPGPTGDAPAPSWVMAGGLPDLVAGRALVRQVAARAIVFARLGAHTYGYGDGCPACGSSFDGAGAEGTALVCPGCTRRFDLVRAGRCLDAPALRLDPVPLLVGEDGLVKVALEVAA